MISFDYLTLLAFYRENEEFLRESRIQRIQQPSRRELILTIRKNSDTKKLYININPQFYHITFISKENEKIRNIENKSMPPMFCMLLRKYIEHAKIQKIIVPKYERIIEFHIMTYNEISEKVNLCLAVELMGKYSNIVLYNYDTKVIIGCAHNVGEDKTTVREMSGTLPYVYPPKQNKIDILKYTEEPDYLSLVEKFTGFSSHLQEKCKDKSLVEIQDMFNLKKVTPCISKDFEAYSIFGEDNGIKYHAISEMIDDYYAYQMKNLEIKAVKNELLGYITPKIKKCDNSLLKIRYRVDKAKDADKYRIYGDLIMSNMHKLKDYVPYINVFDYSKNEKIRIFVDEHKTLKDNANAFYSLYNKSKKALQNSTEYFNKLKEEKLYYEQIKYSIKVSETLTDLQLIKEELLPENNEKIVAKHSYQPIKLKINGFDTYIGKNNKQNDYIVSKLSRSEDLWFHVHNCAGSHVLLKCKNPDNDTILKCADLAKKYSSVSNGSKIGIIYTLAKNLKKPPHAKLGYVIYKDEKEIVL